MMMRAFIFLIGFFAAYFLQAQENIPNPYSSIGKPAPKVATLTNGVYDEFLLKDSLVLINGDAISRKTGQLVYSQEENPEVIVQLKKIQEERYRFLSIDPLTRSYPMLTPYQFASNRPIDGIDLDGMEFIHYYLTFNMATGQTMIKMKWENESQHNEAGELGAGVMYHFNMVAGDKVAYSGTNFFARQQELPLLGQIVAVYDYADYGNYYGPTSLREPFDPEKTNKIGSFTSNYDYSIPAVDAVDEAARIHDMSYDRINAVGENSLRNDWATVPADMQAVESWGKVLEAEKRGEKDPFNNQNITNNESAAAVQGRLFFSITIAKKQNAISKFMKTNYSSEANMGTGTDAINANYSLFLEKYMTMDKEGYYVRKEGMWTQNKDGSYNPVVK